MSVHDSARLAPQSAGPLPWVPSEGQAMERTGEWCTV